MRSPHLFEQMFYSLRLVWFWTGERKSPVRHARTRNLYNSLSQYGCSVMHARFHYSLSISFVHPAKLMHTFIAFLTNASEAVTLMWSGSEGSAVAKPFWLNFHNATAINHYLIIACRWRDAPSYGASTYDTTDLVSPLSPIVHNEIEMNWYRVNGAEFHRKNTFVANIWSCLFEMVTEINRNQQTNRLMCISSTAFKCSLQTCVIVTARKCNRLAYEMGKSLTSIAVGRIHVYSHLSACKDYIVLYAFLLSFQ